MSIYASKTPRDLNHDPYPYRFSGGRVGFADPAHAEPTDIYDPRPEIDHVQNNEPNPILSAIRLHTDADREVFEWVASAIPEERCRHIGDEWQDCTCPAAEAEDAWSTVQRDIGLSRTPTRAEESHARKVLTRLARLSEGANA